MGTRIEVLDHGYVELVDKYGDEERIIEAARMSTNKGFNGWGDRAHHEKCPNYGDPLQPIPCEACECKSGDEKLLKYLYEHKHSTPFEFTGMIIEVQAPIFVFREWHRHRTQSYNEMSARYTPLPDVNYIPNISRLFVDAGRNKQAKKTEGASELTALNAQAWLNGISDFYTKAESMYQNGLQIGIPKEIARVILPVGRYSRMRASANLRNWLAFLTLRMDNNAQWEIRQYANAVGSLIAVHFPRTWELFDSTRSKG